LLQDQDRSLGTSAHPRRPSAPGAGTGVAADWTVYDPGGDRRGYAEAVSAAETDWHQIVELYDALLRVEPSPVVALNQAVAVALAGRPRSGARLDRRHPGEW